MLWSEIGGVLLMSLPNTTTRYLFFTGKGGVGKTSLSCATGLALAESGKRVLIVSTDPASNLDEVLGTVLGKVPTAITQVPGLFALNIDPEVSAHDYRERMVAPYRGILPAAAIASMEEQFSGACTVEIAAFDEFSKLLGQPEATAEFDHVIFDTAPTGHTLRLLTLPSAWGEFIEDSTGGASCLGPLAGLEKQKALYAATVQRLSDPSQTTVILVSRPDVAALREASRTHGELADLGVSNQFLALNGILADDNTSDSVARAMQQRAIHALATMPETLSELQSTITPFLPRGTVGLDALRLMANPDLAVVSEQPVVRSSAEMNLPGKFLPLIEELARNGRGVIMTMGKGGVGKTTVAAAIAVELAARGFPVVLSTTDPAAHVSTAVGEELPNLKVSRIDPAAEVEQYRQEVLAKASPTLDTNAHAMLEEDLRSPCTEEIAVFRAFALAVDGGKDGFVVLDTAPTGHTILLLDAAEAYHREVLRTQGEMPEAVTQLLPRLRDPDYTKVLVVTLPEATPVSEAERLQVDLERAGIKPFAWVINQSILVSGTQHPILKQRGDYEIPFIQRVASQLSRRCALIPWLAKAPVGAAGLKQMIE